MPPRIELVLGDITTESVDAIVNAANTSLRAGGGVDGAITRAAGAEALADRERVIRERGPMPLPTGDAVATIAGELDASWIIHTAGPVYSGGPGDAELLQRCHRSVLRVADELGARTVAFPAISTGVYGYPVGEAAPIALGSVASAETAVEEARFVLFTERDLAVFRAALT
ncbi:MAG TPA: O-acetyl-ADP-ribose deacetylase [Actinomycetota bacterium]|nr:O-acetyl-ADP-ribose deacetylase [Actinomycetota bacterium]